MSHQHYLKSALFLDFDNIFIGLQREQKEAAEQFATCPDKWVKWLEDEASTCHGYGLGNGVKRRLLVRRCYINPASFHIYRSYFIRAGFEVVDCPPLTTQGKTSADIYMAVDILDTLSHPTHFDEFVIFSADADFTPILLRLRKHDRRTTVLAVGPASLAYKSAADCLLEENKFIEKGLGIEEPPPVVALVAAPSRGRVEAERAPVLKKLNKKLAEMISVHGRVRASELVSVYRELPEFTRGSDWLGFFSLRRMTEAIVSASDGLHIVDDDPWWIGAKKAADGNVNREGLPALEEVRVAVREIVAAAKEPVVLAALAHKISLRFGPAIRSSSWLDSGSFKNLVERLELRELQISNVIPGFVLDPLRHTGFNPEVSEESQLTAGVPPIAERVSKLTDMPCLGSRHYAILLQELAKEVDEHGYHFTQTSKNVRDRCNAKGMPVGRSHVSFIMRGILFGGHELGKTGRENVVMLGEALVKNTLDLCRRAQMDLGASEVKEIERWLLGR